jgi:hypothetical protein
MFDEKALAGKLQYMPACSVFLIIFAGLMAHGDIAILFAPFFV